MPSTFKFHTNAIRSAFALNRNVRPDSESARASRYQPAHAVAHAVALIRLIRYALIVFAVALPATVHAAEPVSQSVFGGVAIGGRDTVEYHTLQREPRAEAVKGSKRNTVTYKGAKWRFASAESADKFRADPEAFAPAYNGFCANALSLGNGLVKTDGSVWEIFGQQLYLFYASEGRERWVGAKTIDAFKAAADRAWTDLSVK